MATNFVRASYTEIIDLQTVNDKVSIIGIHTPTGIGPYSKLIGFFQNFRKYRYRGISNMVMIPAANLPVDPLGLTGVTGTTDLMDPRDALNPIMFHGAHGESMTDMLDTFFATHGTGLSDSMARGNVTTGFVSDSADKVDETIGTITDRNYYKFLTDPTWKKFGIQSGVRLKNLHPLTWRLTRSMPMLPTYTAPSEGVIRGTADGSAASSLANNNLPSAANVATYPNQEIPAVADIQNSLAFKRGFVQEFTNGVSRLGWLPTVSYGGVSQTSGSVTILPKLFMGMLVLPPAYNVEQFFRLSIRHVFEFKDFTCSLGLFSSASSVTLPPNPRDTTGAYYNWIDYTTEGAKVVQVDEYNEGTTFDCINAKSEVISDGVN